jgi:anti-sigma regulatory factor (Ser/Thr protein kinase)
VIGTAVADLTHLLAELIENAAQFSPPHTRVRVNGEPVGNGYAVEIEDRGLGMGKETLTDANRRIEQSEALDLFDSDRLGLFVVSRLASRHGIKVHLRTSPYGGTTAVVLLPITLLHSGAAESLPAAVDAERGEEREYARVAAASARTEPSAQTAERPTLARAARKGEQPSNDSSPEDPPPGVATLRLHRPAEEPKSLDDLPRRVRQASLAPQLRGHRPEENATSAHGSRRDDERTPELVRDRMAAYRDGWTRGGGRAPGRPAGPVGVSNEGDHA